MGSTLSKKAPPRVLRVRIGREDTIDAVNFFTFRINASGVKHTIYFLEAGFAFQRRARIGSTGIFHAWLELRCRICVVDEFGGEQRFDHFVVHVIADPSDKTRTVVETFFAHNAEDARRGARDLYRDCDGDDVVFAQRTAPGKVTAQDMAQVLQHVQQANLSLTDMSAILGGDRDSDQLNCISASLMMECCILNGAEYFAKTSVFSKYAAAEMLEAVKNAKFLELMQKKGLRAPEITDDTDCR
jgi:hypothetical protein